MTQIQQNYEILITNLKQNGTSENKWALDVLQIDHTTFVEVLTKRLSVQPYVVPFVNVICEGPLTQLFGEDRIFIHSLSGKINNVTLWNQFVNGMRNYVRTGKFESVSEPSVSPPPSSDSVSLNPTRTQLQPGVALNPMYSESIDPPRGPRGGRKSRAKPRRKTNKNRTRRKSIKKLHRRK